MIAIVKLEALKRVAAAVARAEDWNDLSWESPGDEAALALGERLGWLFRLSMTQVHWTGGGVAAFGEFLAPAEARLGGGAEDLADRALELLLGPAGAGC